MVRLPSPEAKAFYAELTEDAAFKAPSRWSELEVARFDALVLPGGHAPGMRQYLGSEELQRVVQKFWELGRPVGAICHGVLVLARCRDARGKSPLHTVKTTCLPKYPETGFVVLARRSVSFIKAGTMLAADKRVSGRSWCERARGVARSCPERGPF